MQRVGVDGANGEVEDDDNPDTVRRRSVLRVGGGSVELTMSSGIENIIDNYDRPTESKAVAGYAIAKTEKNGLVDKHGERFPKAIALAHAGVGHVYVAWSVFVAEAKGPNAGVVYKATPLNISAFATAELCSASTMLGLVHAKLGLGVDTGASFGIEGLTVMFLGTGFSIGPGTLGFRFLGTEIRIG